MIYPIVLLTILPAIVTLMMTYVVPKVMGVFANTGQDLPALTAFLIAMSEFLRNYGVLLVVGWSGAGWHSPQCVF